MKKVILGIGIVVILAGAVLTYVLLSIDSLAKRVIERAGTDAVGSAVTVGSVDIDLINGNATLGNFRVANPEGFSDQPMMRFEQLSVDIELASLREDVIRINSVRSTNPFVLYELQGDRSNLDVVRERMAPEQPAEPAEPGEEVRLSIGEVVIEDIQGRLQADRLPRSVDVNLGTITLRDMEGTPPVIARQIARPLITQVSRNAASALVAATSAVLQEELSNRAEQAAQELQQQAEQELEAAREQVEGAVNETAEELEQRLRGIFNR